MSEQEPNDAKPDHAADFATDTFSTCVQMAWAEPALVREWERLSGKRITTTGRSPIDVLVDRACGLEDEAYRSFFEFVREFVWLPWITGMAMDAQGKAPQK